MVTVDQIKELRNKTGISIGECKQALEQSDGDIEKAIIILSKKSGEIAQKKQGRELKSGVIQSYIHNNFSMGVMIELACETDFVAKNEDFQKLAFDISMHIAAMSAKYIKKEDIDENEINKITEFLKKETEEQIKDKPEEMKEKILQGKIDSYFKDKILLTQDFIKNPEKTIQQMIEDGIQKFGEKIEIIRFVRYKIGEE
jgi:elongation factor Ts